MMATCAKDKPLGIQLLGCEAKFILKAMDVLKEHKFDIMDFNAACPAKKVVRRGEGSSLLKEPKKLKTILKLVVENSSVPVTVKIRAGWDKNSVNARDIALHAEDAGVKGIFIHGRTKLQGYSGNVDYEVIKKVKEAVGVSVIASGDILSAKLAAKMLNETGCDGLAVARGSLGNPWIFRQIKELLKFDTLIETPDKDEVIRVMLGHLDSCIDFHGERVGVMIFRKFFAWYTRGFRKIRHLREMSSRAKTKNEMVGLIQACAGHKKSPTLLLGASL